MIAGEGRCRVEMAEGGRALGLWRKAAESGKAQLNSDAW
jgi:hypothetical protein